MTGLRVLFARAEMVAFAMVGSVTPAYGAGMHDLLRSRRGHAPGMFNGLDFAHSSPEVDPWVAQRHDGSTRGIVEEVAARLPKGCTGASNACHVVGRPRD